MIFHLLIYNKTLLSVNYFYTIIIYHFASAEQHHTRYFWIYLDFFYIFFLNSLYALRHTRLVPEDRLALKVRLLK